MSNNKICIIGDGGWGTALAIILSQKGMNVTLWGAFGDYVELTARTRENIKFLRGVKIPNSVELTASMEHAVRGADAVILAVPSKYFRGVLLRLAEFVQRSQLCVTATKGIEDSTMMRMSEIAALIMPA